MSVHKDFISAREQLFKGNQGKVRPVVRSPSVPPIIYRVKCKFLHFALFLFERKFSLEHFLVPFDKSLFLSSYLSRSPTHVVYFTLFLWG
jgi:hypothetical protein